MVTNSLFLNQCLLEYSCVSFRCRAKWVSHTYTHSFLRFSHSSHYKVEFPVLESSLLSVIHFISVYMVQLSHPYMTIEKTVRMWEFDHKGWAPKNWCFRIVVLEKTLEHPLDCKKIRPVHPKRNQPSVFIGRTDVEAEAPIHGSPDVKCWLIEKDSDARKICGQEEKGTAEMVRQHHWLVGHECEQAAGGSGGQRSLACCSSWDHQKSDVT